MRVVSGYRFEEFELDLKERRLRRNSIDVKLRPKTFELLRLLVERQGEVVSTEDILQVVWPDVFVDKGTLQQTVYEIREALGEKERETRLLETVPKTGYRFRAAVEEVEAWDEEEKAGPEVQAGVRKWHRVRVMGIVLIALGVPVVLALRMGEERSRDNTKQKLLSALSEIRNGSELQRRAAAEEVRGIVDSGKGGGLALAVMAEAISRSFDAGVKPPVDIARRAVEMEPTCVECRAVYGYMLYTRAWQWGPARRELEEAVRLDKEHVRARMWLGQLLAAEGEVERGMGEVDVALRLEPTNAAARAMRAGMLYWLERYEEAIREARMALGLNARSVAAWVWIRSSAWQLGWEKNFVLALAHERGVAVGYEGAKMQDFALEQEQRFNRIGIKGQMQWLLAETNDPMARERHAIERALWWLKLGEKEKALDELELVDRYRPFRSIYLKVDPAFRSLRGEPRFRAVLRTVGLER